MRKGTESFETYLLLLCIEEKVDSILVVLIDSILWEKRTWEKISHNKAGMKPNVTV